MRIAKEIVNNIESSHRATLGFGESDHLRDIAIVDAKLEPVREVLCEVKRVFGGTVPRSLIEKLDAALALLSEEA